jgi:hypothetical protein
MLAMHFMTLTDVTLDDIADIAHSAGLLTSMYERPDSRTLSVIFGGAKKWYWEDVPKNSWVAGELDDYELELAALKHPSRIFCIRVRQVPECDLLKFLAVLLKAHEGVLTLFGHVFERDSLTELPRCLASIAGSSEDAT